MATLDDIHDDLQALNVSLRFALIEETIFFHAQIEAANCIGCGLCVETCPAIFHMEGDLAVVYVDPVPEAEQAACAEAVGACPASAITTFTDGTEIAILSELTDAVRALAFQNVAVELGDVTIRFMHNTVSLADV